MELVPFVPKADIADCRRYLDLLGRTTLMEIPGSSSAAAQSKADKGENEVMSALGHEQTSRHVRVMSVIPLKADIHPRGLHVRLVPKTDYGPLW